MPSNRHMHDNNNSGLNSGNVNDNGIIVQVPVVMVPPRGQSPHDNFNANAFYSQTPSENYSWHGPTYPFQLLHNASDNHWSWETSKDYVQRL